MGRPAEKSEQLLFLIGYLISAVCFFFFAVTSCLLERFWGVMSGCDLTSRENVRGLFPLES